MTKQLLFMSRPPDDKEEWLEWIAGLSRKITGREPTPEEVEKARLTLGLPPTPKPPAE